ncbi:MAG: hypothetical protein MJ233_04290 [Mycoplasmoidaceae bacterium]|nr:hypothetical protein [Mycoplasmoidaceae bacterium]
MSGFLGLQTSNNVLIDDLKTAVFNDLSESVADSPILSTAGVDKHEINDGALFAWAIPAAAADDYKFGTIT